ncbi:DUF6082 family protein [Cryptosporangium sp. NPDC051539]|uniref:DUF6082 family protein n=1 Tax=Cryptosporangium sp. NPDC051539 TaxID=3363962 RepID=UPI0037BB2512
MGAVSVERIARTRRTLLLIVGVVASSLVLVAAIISLGFLAMSLVSNVESPADWRRLADVGQAFGVLDSLLSGLAFVALLVTLGIQFRELRLQQSELREQREAVERSHSELRRSAEANMRMLHFELTRMSIDDSSLADVWPHPPEASDAGRRRQFIYANLIYQHLTLGLTMAGAPDDVVRGQLRHLFGSPAMRAYWRAAAVERAALLAPDGEEMRIARLGDEVCAELETPVP